MCVCVCVCVTINIYKLISNIVYFYCIIINYRHLDFSYNLALLFHFM